MAFESYYWRSQIKRDLRFIRKKLNVKVTTLESIKLDEVFSQVEIKLFTVTYSLRKLMDTRKLPDSVADKPISVNKSPRNSKYFRPWPWGWFDDYYDLTQHTKTHLTLRKVCDQFIHAEFFQPVLNQAGLIGILYFVSDYNKDIGI